MDDPLNVGVAELLVTNSSAVLASYGLGSCVAVAMFDPVKRVGGLAHVMLPDSRGRASPGSPGKYADLAVESLVEEMIKKGARRASIKCKIVGGAHMFEVPGLRGRHYGQGEARERIGTRNVKAVKRALEALGIPIVGEDTGGNHGRTVRFHTSSGEVEVSSMYRGMTLL